MSIFEKFGLDLAGLSAVADDSLFEGTGTTTFRVGKRTPYAASINGVSIPAYVTVESAHLTRLSLLNQTQISTGKPYHLVTGILKPVKMNVELVLDGQTMSLQDFMFGLVQQSGVAVSREEFDMTIRKMGFNFGEGMPLFFQQFGASIDGWRDAVNAFKHAGAHSAMGRINNAGRIQEAWAHESGVSVSSFELGTVNREMSPRGQGFLNLVDAQIDQFQRILGLRKKAKIFAQEAEKSGLSQEQIKGLQGQAKTARDMSRQWATSWTGAQQRIVNENGVFTPVNIYDPVNAPCGRFTLLIDGKDFPVDLWTNSARAESNVALPVTDEADAEPF